MRKFSQSRWISSIFFGLKTAGAPYAYTMRTVLLGILVVTCACGRPESAMQPLDSPDLAGRVFFPRKTPQRAPRGAQDFMIPVKGAELGARYYVDRPGFRTVLYFHGNGETVPDYDSLARFYDRLGLNLFVVDYRGYGFSTGQPTLRSLSEDPPAVSRFFLSHIDPGAPKPILMGRSLGSSPASDLACAEPDHYSGLILESGFADVRPLLSLLGVRLDHAQEMEADRMFSNSAKLARLKIPVLILHGSDDMLISVSHARANFAAVPHERKTLHIIEGSGHNDLLAQADDYFKAIHLFAKSL